MEEKKDSSDKGSVTRQESRKMSSTHELIDPEKDIRKKYLESQTNKKKAEQDHALLANRIKLLKQEEQKALKKIENTKKKAKEIREIKARNTEKHKQKEEIKRKQDEKKAKLVEETKAKKLQLKQGLEERKMQTLTYKQIYSAYIKQEGLKAKQKIDNSKKEHRLSNNVRKNEIKSKEESLKSNRKTLYKEKKGKAFGELEHKISRNQEDKMRLESEVLQMEQEEYELIQRLQNTQAEQDNAYQELEKVLSLPTTETKSQEANTR